MKKVNKNETVTSVRTSLSLRGGRLGRLVYANVVQLM